MNRKSIYQLWIWLILQFFISNLSFGNNTDNSAQYYLPIDSTENSTRLQTEFNFIDDGSQNVSCQKFWSCFSDVQRLCYCDDLCPLFGDCCEDKFSKNTTEIPFLQSTQTNKDIIYEKKSLASSHQLNTPLEKHLYKCTYDKNVGAQIYTVVGCPVEYTNIYIRKNCEHPAKADRLLHVPVSGVFPKIPKNATSVKFYNFYCAICHGLTDYNFWNPIVSCQDEFFLNKNSDGNQTAVPYPLKKNRKCFDGPLDKDLRHCEQFIDDCAANKSNEETSRCKQGPFQPIVSGNKKFKNKDCAICHNVDTGLQCTSFVSYRVAFDSLASLFDIESVTFSIRKCNTTSIYDPYTGHCRLIHSPRVCNENNLTIYDPTIPCPDCQLLRLDRNEYNHFRDSIRFLKSDLTINESLLYYIENKVYICSKHYIIKNTSAKDDRFDEIEKYITLIGMSLSIIALIVTFCVYVSFHSLCNVPGKMSINLVTSILLADLLFVSKHFNVNCTIVAVCMHYAYLVSFFWMNALSFDAWNTFSKIAIGGRSKHCYKYYLIYCWITPLFIVCISIFVQFTPLDIFPTWLSPKYGPPFCWISNKWALLIFFIVPLFLIILWNIVFYILTIRTIYRTEKISDRMLSKKNKGMFLIYLKLCFIMGINWMFALLHTFTEITIIRYLSVFLNSFQGFWVGCSYIFSKQVWRLLKGKISVFRSFIGHTENEETGSKQTSTVYLNNVKSHS